MTITRSIPFVCGLLLVGTTQTTAQRLDSLRCAQPQPSLIEQRMHHHTEKVREGRWLLSMGIVSALGGSAAFGIKHDSESHVAAGVTTLSFGITNALLALGMLDLSGRRRQQIQNQRFGVYTCGEQIREAEINAELRSAQFFALNTGLDLVYMTAGVFLFILGHQAEQERDWMKGAGIAMAIQGGFLLTFDIFSWIHSKRRAEYARRNF